MVDVTDWVAKQQKHFPPFFTLRDKLSVIHSMYIAQSEFLYLTQEFYSFIKTKYNTVEISAAK